MNALSITVGIPGCGKSTYASKLLTDGRVDIVVSSDHIREALTGDISSQERNDEVFATLHGRVRAGLFAGLDVLVDATNLRADFRSTFLRYAEETYAIPIAFYFTISRDFDVCQQRNMARSRVVPEDIMQRFHRQFEKECTPELLVAEGWKVVNV